MLPVSSLPLHQRYSIYLASVELMLGAVLHAARIPLTGYILSLHQAFCLARAMRHETKLFTPMTISATVAILKTLAPTGKKITPMIAIMAQGFLFNMGTLCFGNNIAGHLLGAVLLCLWGFIQPLLFATLIFGQNIVDALTNLEEVMKGYMPGVSLLMIFAGIICLKIFLAMGVVFAAKSTLSIELWIQEKLIDHPTLTISKRQQKSFLLSLSKDLSGFWFLFSLITVAIFSWWRDDSITQIFLMMTGYLAQGIVLMIVLRLINFQRLINYLEYKGYYRMSSNLRTTFQFINQREIP